MIGDLVKVTIDRPLGSYHPEHKDMYYPVNYGYVEGIMAPEGMSFCKEEIRAQVEFQEQFFRYEILMGPEREGELERMQGQGLSAVMDRADQRKMEVKRNGR